MQDSRMEVLAAVRQNVLASVTRNADLYAESLVAAGVIEPGDAQVARELAELAFDPAYYNLTPREVAELDLAAYVRRMRGTLKQLRGFHGDMSRTPSVLM